MDTGEGGVYWGTQVKGMGGEEPEGEFFSLSLSVTPPAL